MNGNLNYSRWAPPSSRSNSPAPHQVTSFHNLINGAPVWSTLQQEKVHDQSPAPVRPLTALQKRYVDRLAAVNRYVRLFRRLRHKSHFLVYSHQLAITSTTSVSVGSMQWAMELGEAETMFRVDFFEWYVLLERCLVEALAAVEIGVSASYDPLTSKIMESESNKADRTADDGIIGDSKVFKNGYGHRFHANVLSALDQKDSNPLFNVFQNKPRGYLGVAKEFRNRWKDVESTSEVHENEEDLQRRLKRYEKIMRDLKLEEMFNCVLHALEGARLVVEYEVHTMDQQLRKAGWHIDGLGGEGTTSETPWEASADTMELG